MENKYFTPDIEDISVGCEFEMDDTWGGWKKLTLTKDLLAHPMIGLGSGNERSPWYHKIRVPYLTKEQIEGEGFVYRGKISTGTIPGEPFTKIELEFIKNNILIRFDIISNKVMIDKADSTEENVNFYNVKTLYHGECKDINTFRKIIKLLNI